MIPTQSSPITESQRTADAADWLRNQIGESARVGIIAGTGLGGLADAIEHPRFVPYSSIPHFPVSTVTSHDAVLVSGTLGGVSVICLKGRVHVYEGEDAARIVLPTRVLARLGVEVLFVTNAAGGLNSSYARSDLMLISDHVNLMSDNPLVGYDEASTSRFLDTSSLYSPDLKVLARSVAADLGTELHVGVYAGVPGPNLETRAEYRMLGKLGIDAIGMSTTLEAIAAHACGIQVCAFSIITDECFPDELQPVVLQDVLDAAAEGGPKLSQIIHVMISRIEPRG